MRNCRNCGNSLKNGDVFCPNCGQKNLDTLNLKVLLGELANAYFSWDSKIIKTLVPLITKPGKISKEFISGKRKRYVGPLRLYLFFSVLFFFTLSILDTQSSELHHVDTGIIRYNIGDGVKEIKMDTLVIMSQLNRLDELEQVQEVESPFWRHLLINVFKITADRGSFSSYLQKNLSVMFFVFIPAFGWILSLFFRKNKMNYVEHLVFGLYFHSFFFLILWISLVISRVIWDGFPLIIGIIYLFIYFVMGVGSFYERKRWHAFYKSILFTCVYLVLFTIFAGLTIGITVWFY